MARPRLGRVLVTGASHGIGRAIALGMARRAGQLGVDALLLTGRDASALREVSEMARGSGVPLVNAFPADLSTREGVRGLLGDIAVAGPIDTLVNNAGFGVHGAFADTESDRIRAMIAVNVSAVVDLTRALLPGMIERDRGAVLNVASVAAFGPGPFMSVYYASKAFVRSFSEGVAEEVRGTGVHVHALCPGAVLTRFQERAGIEELELPRWGVLSERAVAEVAIRAIGSKRRVVVPGLLNRIAVTATRILPRSWLARFVRRIMRPDGRARP